MKGVVFTHILGTLWGWDGMRWSREEVPFARSLHKPHAPLWLWLDWSEYAVTECQSRWIRKQMFGSCWDPNRKARASQDICVGPGAEWSARQISSPVCRLTAEQDGKGRLYQWGCDLTWYYWDKAGGTGWGARHGLNHKSNLRNIGRDVLNPLHFIKEEFF